MKEIRLWKAAVSGLLLGTVLFFCNLWMTESRAEVLSNYRVLLEQPSPVEMKALTLYQAWDISQTYAQNWSKDTLLISLRSADVDDPDAKQAGQDGRRRTWQAVFTSPALDRQLFLQITDGVTTNAIEDGIHDPGIPTIIEKPLVDSQEALERAKIEVPDFNFSVGRGKGYHFILQSDVEGLPVFTLVGSTTSSSGEQLSTSIDMDPKNGRIKRKQILPE